MARKCHVFLLLCLFSVAFLNAQEIQVNGVAGYNLTYKGYGGADLKGVFHVDNTDFTVNFEALTAKTFSFGVTVCKCFKRELINRCSISFDESISYHEDHVFALSCKPQR